MKKFCVCAFILLTVLGRAENILRNADFEESANGKPLFWLDAPKSHSYLAVDDGDSASGRNSVKIAVPPGQGGPFLFHQTYPSIKIAAEIPLKLSGWFKTENYQSGPGKPVKCGVYTAITFADGTHAYPTLVLRPTEGQWQYQELIVSYPKEIVSLKYLYLMHHNASGTVKFDSIYFGTWTEDQKLSSQKPLFRIPRTASAPDLDGKLDDSCWEKAAMISNFVRYNQDSFAKNATEAYFSWDAENLYIATKSYSSILDPALQMLDNFSAKETARDGSVFSDDSIEIFISRADGNYYQFAYNALGTRYDGHKLEKSWNCEWSVKAAIVDHVWLAEVAIPFSALGMTAVPGAHIGINVCRNDRVEKEASSWNNVETSFHDVESFAIGELASETLQVSARALPIGLTPLGKHGIDVKVTNAHDLAADFKVDIEVFQGQQRSRIQTTASLPAGTSAEDKVNIELKAPGEGKYRYILRNQASGAELLRSPMYRFKTNVVIEARNQLIFPGSLELYHNGQKISGKQFFLEKGTNELLIKCSGNGALSGSIELLDSADSLPESIAFSGDCQTSAEFKKTFFIGSTRLFPFDLRDGIHLEPNVAQHIPLQIDDPAGKVLELLVPAELAVIDFSTGETGTQEKMLVKTSIGPDKTIAGRNYQPYQYTYVCPLSLKKRTEVIFLTLPERVKEKVLYVYFRTKNEDTVETWQKLSVFPTDFQHSGKKPKKLKIELWHSFIGAYTDKQVAELIRTFALTGFNEYVERIICYGNDQYMKPLRDHQMRINAEFHTEHQLAKLQRKYPNARGINIYGKTSPRMRLKPSFICGEGREEVKEIVSDYIRTYRPDSIIIDLEKSSLVDSDASPESLAEFTSFAGLEKTPSTEEILEKYRVEWGDYMCLIWSRIAAVLNEGVKQADPSVQFAIYSSYQSPNNKMKYSIDWSLMRGIIDFAEMGYGRQSQKVRSETLSALGDIPSATGILFYSNTPQKTGLTVKNNILRRITDGAKGITFYNWSRLDAISRAKISEACALLADYEEFFFMNEQLDAYKTSGNIGAEDVVILKGGNEFLLLVFNDRNKVTNGSISLPGLQGMKALRIADGNVFPADKLSATIQPYDTAAWKIYK